MDENVYALRLCYIIEKVMAYGLKDVNIFSKTTPFDFIQSLDKCVPGGGEVLTWAKDSCKSGIGEFFLLIKYSKIKCLHLSYFVYRANKGIYSHRTQ